MTPKAKLCHILSSFKLVNTAFALFGTGKASDATADNMLPIFTYIVLKANIEDLDRHIKFIRIF